MEQGIIMSLGNGFGYVRSIAGQELFFHVSALKNCQFKDLKVGQTIKFTLDKDQPNVIAQLEWPSSLKE